MTPDHLAATIKYALARERDGLRASDLADDSGEPYRDVVAALEQLQAAGVVARSGRAGTWHLVDTTPTATPRQRRNDNPATPGHETTGQS